MKVPDKSLSCVATALLGLANSAPYAQGLGANHGPANLSSAKTDRLNPTGWIICHLRDGFKSVIADPI